MITAYTFKNRVAIPYALGEQLGAHEDVVHAGDSLWIEIGRNTGISKVFIWVIPEDCIFDAYLMHA
jgi:hypothetical protein